MRELENIIERAVIVIMEKTDTIQNLDLNMAGASGPVVSSLPGGGDIQQCWIMKTGVIERFEREYFSQLVSRYRGNMTRASEHAGINIKNIHERMARYGLKKEDFKGSAELRAYVVENGNKNIATFL